MLDAEETKDKLQIPLWLRISASVSLFLVLIIISGAYYIYQMENQKIEKQLNDSADQSYLVVKNYIQLAILFGEIREPAEFKELQNDLFKSTKLLYSIEYRTNKNTSFKFFGRDDDDDESEGKSNSLFSSPKEYKYVFRPPYKQIERAIGIDFGRNQFKGTNILGRVIFQFQDNRAARRQELLIYTVGISLIVMTIGTMLSLFITRRITRPLAELRDRAIELGAGDFSVRAKIHQNDEVGQLADTFNNMVEELEIAQREQHRFISNMAMLQGYSTEISSHLDRKELNKVIVDKFQHASQAKTVSLMIVQGEILRIVAGLGLGPPIRPTAVSYPVQERCWSPRGWTSPTTWNR